MLWDIIRDFIVQHITGGVDSLGEYYYTTVGNIMSNEGTLEENANFNDLYFNIGKGCFDGGTFSSYGNDIYISCNDWLATTITAVIIILLVVFAVWLVRWIFKAVSSAFLLK